MSRRASVEAVPGMRFSSDAGHCRARSSGSSRSGLASQGVHADGRAAWGVLLESCLADELAIIARTRRLIRTIESKHPVKLAARPRPVRPCAATPVRGRQPCEWAMSVVASPVVTKVRRARLPGSADPRPRLRRRANPWPRRPLVGAVIWLALTGPLHAGACTGAIESLQREVDARIEQEAGSGRTAPESAAAMRHRQPTPGSILQAEVALGEGGAAAAARAALARARSADQAGDPGGCEDAVAQARRILRGS